MKFDTSFYDNILDEVSEYIQKNIHGDQVLCMRGQANKDWPLKSSLERERDKNQNYPEILREKDNIKMSLVDKLFYSQHYNIKTRVLDFTSNIDIALYFACQEHPDEDGIVYITNYRKRQASWLDVWIVAELTQLKDKISVRFFSEYIKNKYKNFDYLNGYSKCYKEFFTQENLEAMKTEEIGLRVLSWIDHGFMITPSEEEYDAIRNNNPRMYNQRGMFFVQGNKVMYPELKCISSNIKKQVILPELSPVPTTINNKYTKKIIIPSSEKNNLMQILNNKGINNSFIYPDKD